MSEIKLHKKNWLVPTFRQIRGNFALDIARAFVESFSVGGVAERVDAWREASLKKRGLSLGTATPLWPLPGEAPSDKDRSEWAFLNLLAHRLEMLSELRLLLGKGLDTPLDQLVILSALAAAVDDLDTAEGLYDIGLDDWGDEGDPRREKLAKELTPLARTLGTRLKDAGLHAAYQPMVGLPFHHVLDYATTRQLIDVALILFQATQRPDLHEVRLALAGHQLQKVHLIEAIIGLAAADNTITKVEQRLIDSVIEMAHLSDEDRDLVLGSIEHPPTPEHIAKYLTDPLSRRCIYVQLSINSLLDGDGTANTQEHAYIDGIAEAFDLTEGDQLTLQAEALTFLDANPQLIDAFSMGDTLRRFQRRFTGKLESAVTLNMGRLVTEIKETGQLGQLLAKRATGQLDPEEEKKTREQLLDICRTIPSLAIFALPGGAVLLPIVMKLIPINLLPSSFSEEEEHL